MVSVEKETDQVAVGSAPQLAAEVVQEVDFEAKYQRFLQNEEMEDTSKTALMGGRAEENEETVGEKEDGDEADFCLMTDKPQEVLNAVPTLENTLGLAGADDKQCRGDASSSEDEEEADDKNEQDSDEDAEEADLKKMDEIVTTGDNKMDEASFGIEVQSEIPAYELDTSAKKVNEENMEVEDFKASTGFEGDNGEEEKGEKDSSEGEEEEEETRPVPMASFGPDSAAREELQHPELLEGSATEAKTAAFKSDKMGDIIQMEEEKESDNKDKCDIKEKDEGCEQKE